MSLQRRISWNAALRDVRDDRTKIPAGLLAAGSIAEKREPADEAQPTVTPLL
jgi:hypothetical protein